MEYFGEILWMTAAAGLLLLLLPDGGQRKALRFLISLCLLAAMLLPLFAVIGDLPALLAEQERLLDDVECASERDQNDAAISESKAQIEQAIARYLAAKYESAAYAKAEIFLDDADPSAIEILKIRVILTSGEEREAISADLSALFLGKSEVEVVVL